ncbi:MAG: hypothetical protein ACOC98_13780, partial [Thermodesulfobacteriota bacterium]
TRALHKRRIGMAEAYRRVAGRPEPEPARKRLHALKRLMELSLHAKTVGMPVNTARVQIEMMKTAVQTGDDPRRQMELIADFSRASYGREAEIRRYLTELGRVEIPETARPLREMALGWDDHVHDRMSEGRKTPSEVVLDAFLKGMSRLALAYYDIPSRETVFEATEAGRLTGVAVGVAVEFSVGPARRRRHFMFLPPVSDASGYSDFFDEHCRDLADFVDGLEENRKRRRRVVVDILKEFNRTGRAVLNEGFPEPHPLAAPPLSVDDLERLAPHGQFSRNHLSQLLCESLREVLWRRVVTLRTHYGVSRRLHRRGRLTDWELEQVAIASGRARRQYNRLSPGGIKQRFLTGKSARDYDSAFSKPEDILPALAEAGGTVVFNRPLSFGLANAVETLVAHPGHIHRVEVMNVRDRLGRDPAEIIQLARFIARLNEGDEAELARFLERREIGGIDREALARAAAHCREAPILPVIGSAATGWAPEAPGMGFIAADQIPRRSLRRFAQTHHRLPRPVAALMAAGGAPDGEAGEADIYCLGRRRRFSPNRVGDEDPARLIGPLRAWRYLNPALKNLIRAGAGWLPAWWWIGPRFALVWFCVTFFRNVLVDLVAFSGTRPRAWRVKDIDFDNAAQSLFWTGFSVPALGGVKLGFDHAWPLFFPEKGELVFNWAKFLAICVANGVYISAHNTLRGFDRRTIRVNFFRSVLAWPFSALFAPAGDLLGIPSIVQAKFWSDGVGAVIEGTGKFHRKVVLRRRDIETLLERLASRDRPARLTAMLDILFIWARRQRGRTGLGRVLLGARAGVLGRLRKKGREVRAADLNRLAELFRPQEAQEELIRHARETYNRREILFLARLIRESVVPFHHWVQRLRRREGLRRSERSDGSDRSRGSANDPFR